jgi:leader peptidase (prepilin peptidase)/N-methyltransferase
MEMHEPLMPLWVLELLFQVFIYGWLFWLGATVGSFLNVVIYRLPRGKNLAFPGSSCPRCGHAIRLEDNIPIFSWLALWGRCRDCGGRISPRYFVVELTVATMFLVLAFAERYLPSGGFGFLPVRRPLTPYEPVPYWAAYALHASLATTLLAAALIRGDGFRVPRRLFLPVIFVALGIGLAWPHVRSQPAWQYHQPYTAWAGLMDGLCGGGAGVLLGGLAATVFYRRAGSQSPQSALLVGAALGVVCGWQRTLLFFVPVMLVMELVTWLAHASRSPPEVADEALQTPTEAAAAESAMPEHESTVEGPPNVLPQNIEQP